MARQPLRISAAGVRGVVGGGLTAAHVLDFAAAFGTFLPVGKPLLIGRDPRASGVMLREAVTSALLACGHDVIDLGILSTPMIQHAIVRGDAGGGVSIGASHNAAEWNALKFLGPRGTYLGSAESAEVLDIYHLKRFAFVDWTGVGKRSERTGEIDAYLDELAAAFNFDELRQFRIVVDCCSGTSAPVLERMNERFNTQFILLNARLMGRQFAHEPAINTTTLSLQLAPLVRPLQAAAGFLFDVDADRLALADEHGRPVSEEMILPMLADYLLPRSEGKLVITNLSTTALVEVIAARHQGRVVRVPVGRQAAIDALSIYRPEQVALAGEGTGAVMMGQFRFVYDGIASMLAILSMMAERGQTVSALLAGYPQYHLLKGEVPLQSTRIPGLLMALQEQYKDGRVDATDGLRVDWPDKWFHVRVSQTEPIVRVICEAKGSEPKKLFASLLDAVRQA